MPGGCLRKWFEQALHVEPPDSPPDRAYPNFNGGFRAATSTGSRAVLAGWSRGGVTAGHRLVTDPLRPFANGSFEPAKIANIPKNEHWRW